ncbi:hypothetical protein [Cysteiniphilum sp. QT6929]|uniref:hypothetical protein n=1 Tax=Cysteiniphilum sp. QT6929 TaxID=2975055 RepID=UPI0024B3BFC1|nr:hypothetical protein [Cysteiniphilum sp. QT6929]WHN65124.1 hypothetical protein NYP54_08740 [Cysteiniphilum sp. QT6929]
MKYISIFLLMFFLKIASAQYIYLLYVGGQYGPSEVFNMLDSAGDQNNVIVDNRGTLVGAFFDNNDQRDRLPLGNNLAPVEALPTNGNALILRIEVENTWGARWYNLGATIRAMQRDTEYWYHVLERNQRELFARFATADMAWFTDGPIRVANIDRAILYRNRQEVMARDNTHHNMTPNIDTNAPAPRNLWGNAPGQGMVIVLQQRARNVYNLAANCIGLNSLKIKTLTDNDSQKCNTDYVSVSEYGQSIYSVPIFAYNSPYNDTRYIGYSNGTYLGFTGNRDEANDYPKPVSDLMYGLDSSLYSIIAVARYSNYSIVFYSNGKWRYHYAYNSFSELRDISEFNEPVYKYRKDLVAVAPRPDSDTLYFFFSTGRVVKDYEGSHAYTDSETILEWPAFKANNLDPRLIVAATEYKQNKFYFFFADGRYAKYNWSTDKIESTGYTRLEWRQYQHIDQSVGATCSGLASGISLTIDCSLDTPVRSSSGVSYSKFTGTAWGFSSPGFSAQRGTLKLIGHNFTPENCENVNIFSAIFYFRVAFNCGDTDGEINLGGIGAPGEFPFSNGGYFYN